METTAFWDNLLSNWQGMLLIFARVLGIFSFNPIFSRRNTPTVVKAGASIALAVVIGMSMTGLHVEAVNYSSLGPFVFAILLESFVGFVLGFITQLFLSTMLVAGDVMDTQSGLGMAKIYDPSSGVQMPLFGSVTTYMFILYFFVTNAHLSYIKIFALSFEVIPLGVGSINTDVGMIIVEYFAVVLTLAMKLAMPMIVAQLVLEISVGILMKAVPQIQVMVVNMQLKMMFGVILMFSLAIPLSNYLEKYMGTMLETLEGILPLIAK